MNRSNYAINCALKAVLATRTDFYNAHGTVFNFVCGRKKRNIRITYNDSSDLYEVHAIKINSTQKFIKTGKAYEDVFMSDMVYFDQFGEIFGDILDIPVAK